MSTQTWAAQKAAGQHGQFGEIPGSDQGADALLPSETLDDAIRDIEGRPEPEPLPPPSIGEVRAMPPGDARNLWLMRHLAGHIRDTHPGAAMFSVWADMPHDGSPGRIVAPDQVWDAGLRDITGRRWRDTADGLRRGDMDLLLDYPDGVEAWTKPLAGMSAECYAFPGDRQASAVVVVDRALDIGWGAVQAGGWQAPPF